MPFVISRLFFILFSFLLACGGGGDEPASAETTATAQRGGDCGPVVLSAVLHDLGRPRALERLVEQTDTVQGRTSLAGLRQGALAEGLGAVGIRTDLEGLRALLAVGVQVVAHFGGNEHFVLVRSLDERTLYGLNPAVSAERGWTFPLTAFDASWSGEALAIAASRDVLERALADANVERLGTDRMDAIRGGSGCNNCGGGGGIVPGGGGTSTREPVEVSNGNLWFSFTDWLLRAIGPDLLLGRFYSTQVFSDIEGWQPDSGTGGWAVRNGAYVGSGDRSYSTETWENLYLALELQTVEAGDSYDYETAFVNFRVQDEDNRYYFLIKTDGTLELTKFHGGTQSFLVMQASSHDPLVAHDVEILADGADIDIWIDGAHEIAYTDPDPLTGAGSVVLESYFSVAAFDDIEVADLDSGSVASWDFDDAEDNDGMFGRAWRGSVEVSLIATDSGDVIVRRADDRRERFSWDASLPGWVAPVGVYDSLDATSTGYELRSLQGEVHAFDTDGRLESVADRFGNELTLSYTTVGSFERVSAVTAADGRSLSFGYDADGHCIEAIAPLGDAWTYSYDANGQLAEATDPRGNTTRYGYDGHGRMVSLEDRAGNVSTFSYGYNNRVLEQVDAEGLATTFDCLWDSTQAEDANGNVWTWTFTTVDGVSYLGSRSDPEGHTQTFDRDADGRLDTLEDGLGQQTVSSYDSAGNLLGRTDPAGLSETWTYDATWGSLSSHTDRAGQVTSWTLDSLGMPIEELDALGYVAEYGWDADGQLVEVVDRRGGVWSFGFDAHGQLETSTDPLGNATLLSWDEHGNLLEEEDALGNVTTYGYDANGNRISVTDALGQVTLYQYDELDRLVAVTDALGNTTSLVRDAYGEVVELIDPLGRVRTSTHDGARYMLHARVDMVERVDAEGHVTSFEHDGLGRVVEILDAAGGSTTQGWDANGRLESLTDADGNVTQYQYEQDRLVAVTWPDGSVEEADYDANGRRTLITRATGDTVSLGYDARGQLASQRPSGGASDVFTRDASGKVVQVVRDGTHSWSYEYDERGNLVWSEDPDGRVVEIERDALDRVTAITRPDGVAFGYRYDTVGQVLAVEDASGVPLVSFEYDAVGRETRRTLANGVEILQDWDAAGQLVELWTTGPTGTLEHVVQVHDDRGNLLERDLDGAVESFEYDELSQLVSATAALGRSTAWTFGSVMQRQAVDRDGAVTHFTTNDLHQVVATSNARAAVAWAWDAAGNLMARDDGHGVIHYVHDAWGRLVEVTLPTGTVVELDYDPFGRLWRRGDGVREWRYTWHGMRLLEVRDQHGTVLQSFVYGPGLDDPIRMDRGGRELWYARDAQYNVSLLTDPHGRIVERVRYDVYGRPWIEDAGGRHRAMSTVGNPLHFAARPYDPELRLHDFRARWYSDELQGFIQPDPTGYADGPNRYVFARNNPLRWSDPLGMAAGGLGQLDPLSGYDPSDVELALEDLSLEDLGLDSGALDPNIPSPWPQPTGEYSALEQLILDAFGPPDPNDPSSLYDKEFVQKLTDAMREMIIDAKKRNDQEAIDELFELLDEVLPAPEPTDPIEELEQEIEAERIVDTCA